MLPKITFYVMWLHLIMWQSVIMWHPNFSAYEKVVIMWYHNFSAYEKVVQQFTKSSKLLTQVHVCNLNIMLRLNSDSFRISSRSKIYGVRWSFTSCDWSCDHLTCPLWTQSVLQQLDHELGNKKVRYYNYTPTHSYISSLHPPTFYSLIMSLL